METILIKFSSLNIFLNLFSIFILILFIKAIFWCIKPKYNSSTNKVSDDENDYKAYNDYRIEVDKRILSNIENFDKNILTISTFLLGLSLIFVKDIIGDKEPMQIDFLHSSWVYLLTSIAMTLASFILALKDNEVSLDYYYKYLIEQKKEYENKNNLYSYILEFSTYFSVIFLFLGMLYLYLFIKINF